jgi:hypothetical protein
MRGCCCAKELIWFDRENAGVGMHLMASHQAIAIDVGDARNEQKMK